jgi:hypothetical protein
MLKFRNNAFEHGITKTQIQDVLANRWGMTKWFPMHDDEDGNSQDMVVGFDAEGAGIEIGLTYQDNYDVVFHADKVTASWQMKYNTK